MKWTYFNNEIKELSAKINYIPDMILCIIRGGVIPGTCLSEILGIKDFHTIKVTRKFDGRSDTNKNDPWQREVENIALDVWDKEILLVEDMLETGKGMIAVKEFLESRGAKVKTACLYIMPKTLIEPDFYLRKITEVEMFPWEQAAELKQDNKLEIFSLKKDEDDSKKTENNKEFIILNYEDREEEKQEIFSREHDIKIDKIKKERKN
ncbi:MAG: phosphoribosyltransferase family protein [Candidatus Woesearchaeota archaeon]